MVQAVSTQQRFRRYGEQCPICGGHSGIRQGRGERCAGFISEDGEYVFCTRPECAGALELNEKTSPATFCHKLYGVCKCGKEHNPARPSSHGYRKGRKEQREEPHPRADFFPFDDPRAQRYFPYYDEQEKLLYMTVRYEWEDSDNPKGHSKTYRQFHQEGGTWVPGTANIRRVLYRLPELLKADPAQTVYIVEGETKVEALRELGCVATCNVGGALHFQKEYSTWLRGRRVIILPDNDEKGEKHAQDIVKKLQGVVREVRIVRLADLPEKGDVIDWLAAGGTREQLEEFTAPLPPLEPGRWFSDIEEKEIEWFWEKWIPRGKITMLDAMPDPGKSVFCTTLAAYASTGAKMPDGASGTQGAVILVNLEDDAADTVKPRLLAAGADVSKVIDLSTVRSRDENGEIVERPFQIPRDLPVLEEQITKHGVVLVCLDPLMAILAPSLKSSNDQDMRVALTPLARLLERTRCACVIVRHFNKGSSENALIRGAGSLGIVGAARSQLFVTANPDNPEQHVLALGKHNLSAGTANLVYRIVSNSIGRPKIQWEGTSSFSAAELLSTSKPSGGRQEILRILREADKPLGALEIVEKAPTMTAAQVRQLLSRMSKAGELVSVSRGLYTLSQLSQVSQPEQSSQLSQEKKDTNDGLDCDRDCDGCHNCHNHEMAQEAPSSTLVTNVTVATAPKCEEIPCERTVTGTTSENRANNTAVLTPVQSVEGTPVTCARVPRGTDGASIPVEYQAKLAQLEKILPSRTPLGEVHWIERRSGFPTGFVTHTEYLRRIRVCLSSGDWRRIDSAEEEIERHLRA